MLRDEMDCWIDELESYTNADLADIIRAISSVQLMRKLPGYYAHWSKMPWARKAGYGDVLVDVKVKYDIETTITKDEVIMLDCCVPAPMKKAKQTIPTSINGLFFNGVVANCQHETKEQDMYNEVQEAKRHLTDRAYRTRMEKEDGLYVAFNMGAVYPKNKKQAEDWLARGGVRLNTYGSDRDYGGGGFELYWQDPDKPKNEEGFKAASKLLQTDYINVKDQIIVSAPVDGLKALQEFEAKVYN